MQATNSDNYVNVSRNLIMEFNISNNKLFCQFTIYYDNLKTAVF